MTEPYGNSPKTERFPTGAFEAVVGDAVLTLEFGDYGKFTVARDYEFAVRGSYRVTGSEITFTDQRGPRAGTAGRKSGTYTWSFDGHILLFGLVHDLSPGRRKACAQPWTRMR